MRKNGFSLIELLVSVAIVGLISLALASSMHYLSRSQLRSQAEAELQNDATRILAEITVALQGAGDGLANTASPPGTSIFSDPNDNDKVTDTFGNITGHSSILFISKDNPVIGQLDPDPVPRDEWTKYKLINGQISKEIYISTNSMCIVNGSTAPVKVSYIKLSSSLERVRTLEFNFYNSMQARTFSGYGASAVRVYFELEKLGFIIKRETLILLDNVLYGRNG